MNFADAVRSVLTQYATFGGRAPRSEYWWFYLFTLLVGIVTSVIDDVIGVEVVGTVASLALLIPTIAVTVRRLHDTGRSAWWLLAMVLPVLAGTTLIVVGVLTAFGGDGSGVAWVLVGGLLALAAVAVTIVLMCLPGTPGPNGYGPSPLGPPPGGTEDQPYGGSAAPYGQPTAGQPWSPQPFPPHPSAPPPASGPEGAGGPSRPV